MQVAAEQAFNSITAEDWKNSCRHVMKIEKEYFDRGSHLYTDMEKVVINLQDDSSDSSSGESSEYEGDHTVENSFQDDNVAGSSNQEVFSGVEYLEEELLD